MNIETKTSLQTQKTQVAVTELDGRDMLMQLLQSENIPLAAAKGKDLQALAERLRGFAPTGKKANWSKDYLDNVLHGRKGFEHPAPLIQAIQAMLAAKRGLPEVWAKAYPVQVMASLNEVEPGSLVTTATRRCANAACGRPFIPRAWNSKWCSDECNPRKRKHGKAHEVRE
jgi:hypothetical protein